MILLFEAMIRHRFLPKDCHICKQAIVSAESVLLYCECCVALCTRCARVQLTQQVTATVASNISCPKCRKSPVAIDASVLMLKVAEALKTEDRVLEDLMTYYSVGSYSKLQQESCKETRAVYVAIVERLKREAHLLDLVVADHNESSLRQLVIQAELFKQENIKISRQHKG